MAARYAYWREPSGAAYMKNDGKHAPRHLLAHIGRMASISTEGNIQWKDLSFPWLEHAVVGSAIVVDPEKRELNRDDAWSIISSALRMLIKKTGGRSPIDPGALLCESDKRAARYFRKKEDRFHLVTS